MTAENNFKVCFLFLTVCIWAALGRAETPSEEADPVNLLESSLSAAPKDANAPKAPTPAPAATPIQPPSAPVSAEKPAKPKPAKSGDILIAKNPTTTIGRQLWDARITAPETIAPAQGKSELQKLIEQINSLEFKPQNQTPKPPVVIEPAQKAEPNQTPAGKQPAPQPQHQDKIEPRLSREQVSDQTLQILTNLSQHPDQLHNPLELAEILFNSHHLKEAAACYKEALNRITAAKTTDPFADKAWILFQLGNCLQNIDPQTAIQMYRQLILEHPDSPWTDLAKARCELIDWFLKDKPDTLIKKSKSQGE